MRFSSLEGDRGAGLVEYALVVMLISVAALTAVGFAGERTSESFEAIGSSFDADGELDEELSPEEKWKNAQADYADAIAAAKANQAEAKAKAKAEYNAAVAANKKLPTKERNAANAAAKAKQNSANGAATSEYNTATQSAKAARKAALADYNANK